VVVVPAVDVAVPTKDEKARIRLSRVAKGKLLSSRGVLLV
jgi:hypothetical protein